MVNIILYHKAPIPSKIFKRLNHVATALVARLRARSAAAPTALPSLPDGVEDRSALAAWLPPEDELDAAPCFIAKATDLKSCGVYSDGGESASGGPVVSYRYACIRS